MLTVVEPFVGVPESLVRATPEPVKPVTGALKVTVNLMPLVRLVGLEVTLVTTTLGGVACAICATQKNKTQKPSLTIAFFITR